MDVTSRDFEREVLQASSTVPVVVDFWAPWCAPCRALKPILEKLAAEYGGRFKLAKVNSDENQDIAAAFGVRSIPDVVAFRGGRPVAHFLGALPESQVRAFVDKLLESADNEARLAEAQRLIDLGRADDAAAQLDALRFDVDLEPRVQALRAAIAFARSGADQGKLRARLAADPADHGARFALAGAHAGAKRYRAALDELLEIVARDKDWNDGAARKQILNIFNLAQGEPGLVAEYRSKLARALY
ncbi:MAG TPA: thioredoxin [Burkholderiales bacterium]|nr:thioredoxin [Burkholderiales bacterium]